MTQTPDESLTANPNPKPSLQPGVRVRLKKRVRGGFQTAKIIRRDDSFRPGEVCLDRSLGENDVLWRNVRDLCQVKK